MSPNVIFIKKKRKKKKKKSGGTVPTRVSRKGVVCSTETTVKGGSVGLEPWEAGRIETGRDGG